MRSIPVRLWALVLLSAFLQLLPFPLAGPVPPWRRLFAWICLVPLLYALSSKRLNEKSAVLQSAVLGYTCGVVWFLGNCYWVYQTMFRYGGLPEPASLGILILFSLYLGIYLGAFGAGFALMRRHAGPRTALLLSPCLWVAVELARARITGFPWDLLGYTQVDNSLLTRMAPFTGVMGISLILAVANALWLWRAKRFWLGPLLASALVVIGIAGMFLQQPPETPSATAVLLQDNLSVGAELQGKRESQADLLQSFTSLTMHPELAAQLSAVELKDGGRLPTPDLVAWPEAPTPFIDADPTLRSALHDVARAAHAPVVVEAEGAGTVLNQQGRVDQFVSASFFLPDGSYAGRYDKMHLVPFGEYTPYKPLFFFAGHLLDQLTLVPGTQRRLFRVNGHNYGVFICYESIFGDEIREFARSGAQVLVNLSDDGWYGDTSAPWEHLDMARMRAIENRRWLLRATNTGLTASIDPEGRIVSSLPRHIRDSIEVPFSYRSDLTLYTRHGDWIGWLCAVVVVAGYAGALLRGRFPQQGEVPGKLD